MNTYRVRYWPMSDGQVRDAEVEAEDVAKARQIILDDFDKYTAAQVMSVVLVRREGEAQ